jgi:Kef-type K+ transport system membrane component KefB
MSAPAGGHGIDLQPILAGLVLILVAAKAGGAAFERLRLPAVLGELLAGIVLGNLGLVGLHALDPLRESPTLEVLAQIGVLFLLFEVGLHSDLKQMLAVGTSSALVAILGVVAPMALGYFVSAWFFPAHPSLIHWFVGATLAATSVGITARVLADLGRTGSKEGRIILGAAVLDDVLGLVVLAVVAGTIESAGRGAAFSWTVVGVIVLKAIGFLLGAITVGAWLSRRVFRVASMVAAQGLLLPLALAFLFLLSWAAGELGLAPIVGAFAAGIVLDELHYRSLREKTQELDVPELMRPLSAFLVPVFFVLMGMHVDLSAFARMDVLAFAAVLTVAAIAGKQICSLGVLEKGADRFAVGLGMIPRGEVGLIFAGIGASLVLNGERVIDDAMFSAVVIMVAVTTLVTPPLLAWRLSRAGQSAAK